MDLDLSSVVAIAAVVEILAGAMALAQALLHRESRAARIWALAFFASILTTVCYLAWALAPEAWIGNSLGNASFVIGIGCLWLGAARYNRAYMRVRVAAVVVAGVAAFVASVFDVRDPWAGVPVLFLEVSILAALGAIESRRGVVRRRPLSLGLTLVLALTAAWSLLRFVLFVASGPDSAAFQTWGGSVNAGIVTIALSVVAVTTTSVLVAQEGGPDGPRTGAAERGTQGWGVSPSELGRIVADASDRARRGESDIAVLALVIPDFDEIREAFGPSEAWALEREFRISALRHVDPTAPIMSPGPGRVVAVLSARSPSAAQDAASAAHRLVAADLAARGRSLVPLIGGGLAIGSSGRRLIAAAIEAAERSAATADGSVVVVRDADEAPARGGLGADTP